eukprot:Polyplicarium_translucidae@DN1306_c0_g1_i2.p1
MLHRVLSKQRTVQLYGGELQLLRSASAVVFPFINSEAYELDAIADPHPKVLNFTSLMTSSSTFTCSLMTSPHAALPTTAVISGVVEVVMDFGAVLSPPCACRGQRNGRPDARDGGSI